MSESLVGLLIVSACGFGLVTGWLITRKEYEIKLLEAQDDFDKKLDKALRRHTELLKEHNALLTRLQTLSKHGATADQLNLMWQDIRSKLSNG